MKIREIRLYHLRAKLEEPIGNALTFFDTRESLLVEVVGEGGLTGWGETWPAPDAAATIIAGRLAPRLLGEDAEKIGKLWQQMSAAVSFDDRGAAMMAVAALDMALHDLVARERGIPLSTLLGGAVRDRVPAYASGPFFKPGGHPYREFRTEAAQHLRAGFRAIKLRSGFDPREDAAIATSIRREMEPGMALMVDFNQAYTPRAAIEAARRMEAAELLWIEEPALPEDVAGYRTVAAQVRPSVAGGECLGNAAGFRDFLAASCLDILQPDIAICGGFTGIARVAALAATYDRPLVPHVWGTIVNFQAALHLTATLPAHRGGGPAPYPFLEYDVGPNPLLRLLGAPALNGDGTISVPETPGLGIELTPDRLAPYVVESRTLN